MGNKDRVLPRWLRVLLPAFFSMSAICVSAAQTPANSDKSPRLGSHPGAAVHKTDSPEVVKAGEALFQQNCAFCHGRDAAGGETGPDLTRSRVVSEDIDGDKIGPVVRYGRPEKGMPPFDLSALQITTLTAFLHRQQIKASARKGGRKGVDVSDLQTGNVEEGKKYFQSAGGCSTCHSPTGDLAGIASRHQGLELEQRMLYPKDAKSKVTVALASGQTVTGTLEYLDEFTVGLFDSAGVYQSWSTSAVKYKVDAPVEAHVALFGKYSDADIHNLMAYLQTLR